jgi:hypothetical protein
MPRFSIAIVELLAIALVWALPAAAQRQERQTTTLSCKAFKKNPDGSWSPVQLVTISGPNGKISMNNLYSFRPGVPVMGLDVATMLDQQCP